ncbi:MAG: 30S ribosomal protein S12 methylthiotransferase RimO [Bacteroidales bacterium]|nr:30S ribosomal protein S12 methylthiotransferase RimO [Bacteroidales bacterium]
MNKKTPKLASIISLGCSKNLVDSEQLLFQLQAAGYSIKHNTDQAEGGVVIINTCGFIQDAKEESIEVILQYAAARKRGKISKLIVMGCLSERYMNDLEAEIPEVDAYFGKFNWQNILNELGEEYREADKNQRILTTPPHYAYIKISEGCNRRCSFCAIPLITGRHRSRSIEDITLEIKDLTLKGVKEFQLIAQDLSYYGKDLYKENKLAELIETIADIPGVEWLRLHYTYPRNFPLDILPVIRERNNVCKYLDMALQHCSDGVLQKMQRGIDHRSTLALIEGIRKEVPGIHLRTTLMVGHPGETEADFEALKQFVREFRFERMGAFAYSDEEGTYANRHYTDDVPQEIKQARLDELMSIQQEIAASLNQKKIGQVHKVIIDREEAEYYIARTQFDSPEVDPEVFIDKTQVLTIGEFYQARIYDAGMYDLYAKIQA